MWSQEKVKNFIVTMDAARFCELATMGIPVNVSKYPSAG
jgi:hypothetical protein